MKLYEIDDAILACTDAETGEIIDEDKLNALLMERDKKCECVGVWIKNLESLIKALKDEEDTLKKRRETAVKKAEALKKWLADAVGYQKFETAKVIVTFRKSTAAEVDAEKLPKKWFVRKITLTPDKTAIKSAILAGQKIKGASLVERQNIQIK